MDRYVLTASMLHLEHDIVKFVECVNIANVSCYLRLSSHLSPVPFTQGHSTLPA